jgi:PAS domain S-box-containing protein
MALLKSNRPYTIQSIDSSRQLRQRAVEKLESDSSRQLRQLAIAKLEARLTCVPEAPTPAQAHALLKELRVHQIELEMQNEELRRTQADLEKFRARYFDLYERAPVGYLTVNEEGVILEANLPASVLFGMNRSVLVRRNFSQCIESADRDIYYLTRNRLLKTGAPHVSELRMLHSSGALFWAELNISFYEKGESRLFRIVIVDINDRKIAELRLEEQVLQNASTMQQLQARDSDLRSSLDEKETLLKEVHHRVKNSLQVISSLLRMQGEMLKDDHRTGMALRESHQRVMSMALVHERLYTGQNLSEIDFGEYIQTLVEELSNAYPDSAGSVICRLDTSCVLLNVGQAIPCALILNELVTNALKFAYPPAQAGEIVVALIETLGLVTFSVSDQGVGLPLGMDWRNARSMGLAMVALLSEQIEGTLSVHSSPGTTFTIAFPKEAGQVVTLARAMTA